MSAQGYEGRFEVAHHAVHQELQRQIEKWGVQSHDLPVYLTVLVEEVGEVAEAVLEARHDPETWTPRIRKEAIQVAAVAMAIVEGIDAGRCHPGEWVAGKAAHSELPDA